MVLANSWADLRTDLEIVLEAMKLGTELSAEIAACIKQHLKNGRHVMISGTHKWQWITVSYTFFKDDDLVRVFLRGVALAATGVAALAAAGAAGLAAAGLLAVADKLVGVAGECLAPISDAAALLSTALVSAGPFLAGAPALDGSAAGFAELAEAAPAVGVDALFAAVFVAARGAGVLMAAAPALRLSALHMTSCETKDHIRGIGAQCMSSPPRRRHHAKPGVTQLHSACSLTSNRQRTLLTVLWIAHHHSAVIDMHAGAACSRIWRLCIPGHADACQCPSDQETQRSAA